MTPYINKALAQQIVDTVKDLCGQNVNFIDCSGMIFASTDENRIGSFHEIGWQAAADGKIIEVTENNRFTGTQKGVNLPIYHNHEMIAVIGITGEPEEIRKYAHLAERITRLLIREKELDTFNRTEAEKKSCILRALIDQEDIHPDYLRESLALWGIPEESSFHLIRIRTASVYSREKTNSLSSLCEAELHRLFQQLDIRLWTFVYPDEYIAVMEHEAFRKRKQLLQEFAQKTRPSALIGVGSAVSLRRLKKSAAEAASALKSLEHSQNSFAEFSELTLELILSSVDSTNREAYLSKTIGSLSKKDRELLKIYFQCNMSLKETCEKTFIHKNTLQYRLNQIYHHCGYNPRSFRDAAALYLALML